MFVLGGDAPTWSAEYTLNCTPGIADIKVRKLLDLLVARCGNHYIVHQHCTKLEAMIKFKGRLGKARPFMLQQAGGGISGH